MRKKIFLFLFVLMFLCVNVYAHSGGTDGAGGHYNHSTGEYHYHHGYPEHQHPNGVCPYENDSIQEKIENGVPLTQDEYRAYKGLPPLEDEVEEDETDTTPAYKVILAIFIVFWWIVIPIGEWIFKKIKRKNTRG